MRQLLHRFAKVCGIGFRTNLGTPGCSTDRLSRDLATDLHLSERDRAGPESRHGHRHRPLRTGEVWVCLWSATSRKSHTPSAARLASGLAKCPNTAWLVSRIHGRIGHRPTCAGMLWLRMVLALQLASYRTYHCRPVAAFPETRPQHARGCTRTTISGLLTVSCGSESSKRVLQSFGHEGVRPKLYENYGRMSHAGAWCMTMRQLHG